MQPFIPVKHFPKLRVSTHLQKPLYFWKEAPRKRWRALEPYSPLISARVDFSAHFPFS